MDPPYYTTDNTIYKHQEFDVDKLTKLVKECRGFVAISGYGDEWDHLGWHKHTKEIRTQLVARTKKAKERTEVLWTNKQARSSLPKGTLGI